MQKKILYLVFCGVFAFLEKSASLLPSLPATYLTPGPARVAQLPGSVFQPSGGEKGSLPQAACSAPPAGMGGSLLDAEGARVHR